MKFIVMPDLQYKIENSFGQMFHIPSEHNKNDFKQFLLDFLEDTKHLDAALPEIKSQSKEEVYSSYKDLKYLSSSFDKLHEKYYDEKYLGDEELKILLNDIDKQLNKFEAVAHKYYTKFLSAENTPEYLKSGLIQYSQDVLRKKLSQ